MRNSTFLQPIVAALALAPRWPSIVAWMALFAVAIGSRALQTQLNNEADIRDAIVFSILWMRVGTALVAGVLVFFLGRALLAPQTGHARPLYLRFIGLLLLIGLISWFISGAGSLAIFSGEPSQWMMTYGSILVGSAASIVTFPFFVRMLGTAAGAAEPRLGRTWGFVFDEAFIAWVWYAVCAVAFPVLMVFAFANLLAQGNEANALPGNLMQSAITATGGLLQYLLAIVVAQWAIPGWRREAEAFA